MDRLIAVLVALVLFGGAGALGAWWVAKQRALHKKRDFRTMYRRRRELWNTSALLIAGLLLAAAFIGAAYVFARGGVY